MYILDTPCCRPDLTVLRRHWSIKPSNHPKPHVLPPPSCMSILLRTLINYILGRRVQQFLRTFLSLDRGWDGSSHQGSTISTISWIRQVAWLLSQRLHDLVLNRFFNFWFAATVPLFSARQTSNVKWTRLGSNDPFIRDVQGLLSSPGRNWTSSRSHSI